MSLKILVFPIVIVIVLTVIIGYIKPDISLALEERAKLGEKRAALAKLDTVIANVRSQNAAITERAEAETFVLKYLPPMLEQERVLDTVNYLAGQSGVVVTEVALKENPVVEKELPLVYASQSFQEVRDAGVTGETPPPPAPKKIIRSYRSQVSVVGNYENIKDFFARLARTDRYHQSAIMGVTVLDDSGATAETAYPAGFLKGYFEADFVHYSAAPTHSVVDQPMFQTAQFDFSAVDSLLNFVRNPLPALEVGGTGKPNPFQ